MEHRCRFKPTVCTVNEPIGGETLTQRDSADSDMRRAHTIWISQVAREEPSSGPLDDEIELRDQCQMLYLKLANI